MNIKMNFNKAVIFFTNKLTFNQTLSTNKDAMIN